MREEVKEVAFFVLYPVEGEVVVIMRVMSVIAFVAVRKGPEQIFLGSRQLEETVSE